MVKTVAPPGVDRRVEVNVQYPLCLRPETVLLDGAMRRRRQPDPGSVVQHGLVVAWNGFLLVFHDAEGLVRHGRKDAQVATAPVSSDTTYARDGKAPDHRVVEIVAGVRKCLAVGPDGSESEGQLGGGADLPVVPGRTHEEVDVAAVVRSGKDAQAQGQQKGDRFFHSFIVNSKTPP